MTARNAIILGFIISCAALIINAVVLSQVTDRLHDTETAHAALTESLNEQMKIKDEGEKKFENYRLQTHLAPLLPEKTRENLLYDAGSLFHDFVLYLYSAGNDLSMTEFRRAETEIELEDAKNEAQRPNDEANKNELAEKPEAIEKRENQQFERAFEVLKNGADESGKIDYKAKHRAVSTITDLIVDTKDDDVSDVRFERIDKFLNERFVKSYDKKRLEIARLKDLRDHQTNLVNYCVFGSLILQMLGLVFIFLKDFIQDKRG